MVHPKPRDPEEYFGPDSEIGRILWAIRGGSDPVSATGMAVWLTVSMGIARSVRSWMRSYRSAYHFQKEWKWIRLAVPLQLRLIVEQVLWDRGGDWRKLVTGFRPISGKR